jgi:hypothetical protein
VALPPAPEQTDQGVFGRFFGFVQSAQQTSQAIQQQVLGGARDYYGGCLAGVADMVGAGELVGSALSGVGVNTDSRFYTSGRVVATVATFVVPGTNVVKAGTLSIRTGHALTTAARAGAKTGAGLVDDAAAATGPARLYSARVLKRMGDEPGPFHNFPGSFDETVFSQGSRTVNAGYFNKAKQGLSNDSVQYRLPGEINGRAGMYEIFSRPSISGRTEVIMHRFFRPGSS